jgi:hypothetical protein
MPASYTIPPFRPWNVYVPTYILLPDFSEFMYPLVGYHIAIISGLTIVVVA